MADIRNAWPCVSLSSHFNQFGSGPRAKLKADAQKVVSIISGDKAKTQAYCQVEDLTEQLDQAVQQKDIKKARALVEKIAELNKKMGPEFAALVISKSVST